MLLQGVIPCQQVPGSKFESFGLAVLGKENVAQHLKYLNQLSVTVQKRIVYRALNTRKEWLD